MSEDGGGRFFSLARKGAEVAATQRYAFRREQDFSHIGGRSGKGPKFQGLAGAVKYGNKRIGQG